MQLTDIVAQSVSSLRLVAALVPLLRQSCAFLGHREHYRRGSIQRAKGRYEHSRSLSVPSSPSRKSSPPCPCPAPPPALAPKAPKCCAWSIMSARRSLNVYDCCVSLFIAALCNLDVQLITFRASLVADLRQFCGVVRMGLFAKARNSHIKKHAPKAVPQPTCTNKP